VQHLDNQTLKPHISHTDHFGMTFTEEILTGEAPSTPYARLMAQSRDFGSRGLDAWAAGNKADAQTLFTTQTHLFDLAQQIAADMSFESHVGLAAKWAA